MNPAGAYAVRRSCPAKTCCAAALPKGSENVEAVDSAMRALNADGTIESLARTWLHTQVSEGEVEHVPALRTDE